MTLMQLNSSTETPVSTTSIPNEDIEMEEEVTFVRSEELGSYEIVSFPSDPTRLGQENDGINSDTDEDSSSNSDDGHEVDDDEHQLRSIDATVTLTDADEDDISSLQFARRSRKQANAPKVACGKNVPHSLDIKYRALFLKLCGATNKKASEMLGLAASTIRDHDSRFQARDGNAEPIKHKKTRPSKITEAGSKFLVKTVETINTATLEQLQELYFKEFGLLLAVSTIYRHLVHKLRITIKRAHIYPERRTNEETKDRRAAFVHDNIQTGIVDYRLNSVFVDEASFMANMRRNYAWAPAGEVAHVIVPQMYARSRSMLAAISYTGAVKICTKINKGGKGGGTKTQDFYAFLTMVMDELDKRNLQGKGWNIICDNAAIHTAEYIRNKVADRGYRLVLLPRYSPFLNPIEEFFSKVKFGFRRVNIQHQLQHQNTGDSQSEYTNTDQMKDIDDRLAMAISKVTPRDYVGYIDHSIEYFDRCLAREDNL